METIPHQTLRDRCGEILRRVEAGERFVITTDGRPVAVLAPHGPPRWVPAEKVRRILAAPTDPTVLDDLRRAEEAPQDDPWER